MENERGCCHVDVIPAPARSSKPPLLVLDFLGPGPIARRLRKSPGVLLFHSLHLSMNERVGPWQRSFDAQFWWQSSTEQVVV